MVFLRRGLPWAGRIVRSSNASTRSIARPRAAPRWIQRRPYSDKGNKGHDSHDKPGIGEGSDVPWAVTSYGITGLGVWYILSTDETGKHNGEHGDDHHGDEKQEAESEDGEGEEKSDEGGDEGEDSADDGKDSSDESKDTPPSSDDESDKMSTGEQNKQDQQKADEEVKEGNASDNTEGGERDTKGDGNAKTPRTNAKHRSNPHDDATKSKKAEGVVETAKVTHTIDPRARKPPA